MCALLSGPAIAHAEDPPAPDGAALTQVDAKVHGRSGYADAEVYHPRYSGYFRE